MEAIVTSVSTADVEDPEALLNVWLGELDNLTLGLDKVTPSVEPQKPPVNDGRPLSSDLNVPRIDSLRYSMANMEDTQDVDLDAILGELCALENEYEEAIRTTNVATRKSGDMSSREVNSPNNNSRLSQLSAGRTHSPDNDSAYSDSLSLLSSESSTSTRPDLHHPQNEPQNAIANNAPTSKAEKIRLAMQKIKEASVKKIFVKVFNDDGSVKSLLVDETMTCGYITRVLAEKNHRPYDPRCALVEHLTDLNMERVYEENELLVTELMRWTYSSKNRLHFSWDRPEKTLLFDAPWLFVGPADPRRDREPAHHHSPSPQNIAILEEFFAGSGVPSVEGPLYIKSDSSRKGWKRYHCILRSSGLYYWPKDKAKCSSKDLICLATFDVNMVYYGVGWKKRYKAPTDHCFALKHPALQEQPKSSKYIKYLCADDPTSLHRWVTAVRLVKYGRQLLTDYKSSLEECRHVDLVSQRPPSSSSSSSSSGCDVGFESDFPCGTIKRKPAKIPLTSTTRQLKSAAIGEEECYLDEDLPPPPPELMVDDDEELPAAKSPSSRNSLFLGTRSNPRFLEDLHRVVEKKWQVAEKCRLEVGTSPHQVLGFRDYDKSLGVSQWVEEHYGGSIGSSSSGGSLGARGRGPAPPPPPRAPTTVLSRR
ncbi:ras-associated and pleckstrin homology domains-containing protein 1-like isoform X2 [Rhodnius prolixus]